MRRAALLCSVALLLTACGGGDEQETATPATSAAASAPTSAAATPAQECPYKTTEAEAPAGVTKDLKKKPTVPKATGKTPTELQVADIVEGTGPEATTLSKLQVKYVGALHGSAKEFDSSWSRGAEETLPVTVCSAGTIIGFSVGPTGMKQGGRRMITIPAELGYGAQGSPPTIPAKAALVFIIDLVSVA